MGLALALLAACFLSTSARADRLDLIKKRGAVIVGVKLDYPPFGMLDAAGDFRGFEHDLAADLARRLGVELRKVGVTGSNRLQKLEDGSIDILLATMGDTADRRRLATLIEPDYYASGVTLMMPPGRSPNDWSDLRGKKICATQGAYFNRPMAQRYLLDLQMFNNVRDAKLAMRDGRCVGWMFDDTAIAGDIMTPEWKGYEAPLPSSLVDPWAVAIARDEEGGRLERIISDTIADWHRTGFLIEREAKWGLRPSGFLAEMHRLWSRTGPDGLPICLRRENGQWPPECRNKAFLTSADVGGLERLGLFIKERIGLDLEPLYDDYDRAQLLSGLATTLLLTVACVLGSLFVGVVGAFVAEARVLLLSNLCLAGATVARMTPPLLQIYVLMFGIGSIAVARWGILFNPFAIVVLCLSLYTGAATMAALLDGAAHARASRGDFRLTRATLPEVLRVSSGPVTAALVNVVKATGMASAVAVPELISASTSIIAERGNVAVVMNLLMATFIVLVFAVVRLFAAIERRVKRHGAA